MADGNDLSPAPPQPASPPEQSLSHVNLRVTYLLSGNPKPPHSLGWVDLNTTLAALKERIQSELPEHPLPQDQRLIYQGRPIVRNESTLRQVLRLENNAPVGPLPYTLHIIVGQQNQPVSQSSQHPATQTAQPTQEPPPTTTRRNPTPNIQASATGLQDALSRIQRSIETNRADLRSVQQRIAMQHHDLAIPPHLQQPFQNAQPFPMPVHMPQLPATPPNFIPGPVNFPGVQAAIEQHQQHVRQYGGWPPGHLNHPPHALPQLPAQPNPSGPTPAQVQANVTAAVTSPHQQVPHHQVQEFQGPNGQRVTVVTDHMSLRLPLQRPASAPGQPSSRSSSTPRPPTNGQPIRHQHALPQGLQLPQMPLPQVHLPQQPLPQMHLPYPFAQTRAPPVPSAATTAWIVSSPSGPHAVLLAPNHGYFSSPSARTQPIGQTSYVPPTVVNSAQAPSTAAVAPPQIPQPPIQLDGQGNENANRALIRQNQGPAVPALVQAQQNRQDNDLFAFLIQRGWLFLRLYLFMFVFSEPGTWKRWVMIVLATIICLQPRNGPLTRAFVAARQHFDNLIGPPTQRPAQDPAARRRATQNGQRLPDGSAPHDRAAQRPAHVRGAVQMTPEEAAARLIREHQNQELGFLRNAFYRVEQSIALFLASLIPGVGERHVRAREEVRREAQRLADEERRRIEEETAAVQQSQQDGQDGSQDDTRSGRSEKEPGPEVQIDGTTPAEPGNSSGVQVRDTAGQADDVLRNRTT